MVDMRVLIVDDEAGMLEVCGDTLRKLPRTDIVLEQDSNHAAERIKEEHWDLLVADIRMPGLSGVDLLRLVHEHASDIDVLMITAFPSVDSAVESMKLGAADYLTKPFLPDELRSAVRRILDNRRLRQENMLLKRQLERPYSFGEMIGQSDAMLSVFDTVERVAATDVDVLIQGETGTGKELVARAIHTHGGRKEKPFVPVDCGAIPEDLLESEFFGHERGAFTGATRRSMGLMEYASGGTLLLDEVGELPIHLQAKLLRAIQERRVRRVGGNSEIDVDVRIVAATSRDLDEEVRHDRFRSDLYYRINVVRIDLPPLRERLDDIPALLRHFLQRYAREMGREDVEMDTSAAEVLASYSWPGNVRELQNVVKRMLAMAPDSTISINDLPAEIRGEAGCDGEAGQPGFFDLRDRQLEAFERRYLGNLLETNGGDVTAAASEAEVPRGTFYRLLNKHGITPSDYRN
ncbi:MAG: sigma-54 dependent transcriptional regulator [Rhodothermales bacterium]